MAQPWEAVAEGNRRFAVALYKALSASGMDNLCFSPFGVALGLALVHAGASGETRREMDEALGFPTGERSAHELLSGLVVELAGRSEPDVHQKAQWKLLPGVDFGFHLKLPSGLWRQSGYPGGAADLDILRDCYSVAPVEVDFENAAGEACAIINEWVEQNTGGRINRVVSADQIDGLTRLIFANAIYFKAAWVHPFPREATAERPFHLLDGSQITVSMMRHFESFSYKEIEGAQIVELPYRRLELRCVVLLPPPGRFVEFEESLDTRNLEHALFDDESESTFLALSLPKFRIQWQSRLRAELESMGLRRFFVLGSDLSAISPNTDFGVSDVLQACSVTVDEEGTEAAAATLGMALMGVAPKPIEVRFDRPFLFFIVDRPTRIVLFAGRVVRPECFRPTA